jgi:Glucodextranase, domain N.
MIVSFTRKRLAGVALAAASCLVLGVASGAGGAPMSVAPDGPGALSHFDLARKGLPRHRPQHDVEGLVHGRGGVLSDVYYPTIDNTNVETLQYVVTDGSTFTDLQRRDMTSRCARSTTAA